MKECKDLGLSLENTLEWLVSHWTIDSIPDDEEIWYLSDKNEELWKESEGFGRLLNWELYDGSKLVAYRKPIKGGIIKQFTGIGAWSKPYKLEINHDWKWIIEIKKV